MRTLLRSVTETWYHSIELAPGEVTPGQVDLRGLPPRLFADDLRGRRALDAGTFDGFWAFELEKRGADVVAIDVDQVDDAQWPPLRRDALRAQADELGLELGRGFRIAAERLGSRVERVVCDVRELDPERIGGPVDLAFCGALLVHLRDPVGALERLHATVRPGGTLVVLEPVAVRETALFPRRAVARYEPLSTTFNWWRPNLAALRGWLATAGFADVRRRGFHRPPSTAPMRTWYVAMEARR
jgi:tRNA (mo5U34)-methyltransferase